MKVVTNSHYNHITVLQSVPTSPDVHKYENSLATTDDDSVNIEQCALGTSNGRLKGKM